MPCISLIAFSLAMAAQDPAEPPITVNGLPWAPFISPMGEPFRARSAEDNPLTRWFAQADRNGDGALTLDEMVADGDRFFATLDTDRDGEIGPEEIVAYETDIAPEVQVNTRWKRTAAELATAKAEDRARGPGTKRWREDRTIDGYQLHARQGAARYGLLNIPQPVAAADADFNRGTTLAEFREAARQRFALLDTGASGRLVFADLALRLPARPRPGTKDAAPPKKAPADSRYGRSLPEGN